MFKKRKSLKEHFEVLHESIQKVQREIEYKTAVKAYAMLNEKVNLLAEKLGYKFEIEPAQDEKLVIKKK